MQAIAPPSSQAAHPGSTLQHGGQHAPLHSTTLTARVMEPTDDVGCDRSDRTLSPETEDRSVSSDRHHHRQYFAQHAPSEEGGNVSEAGGGQLAEAGVRHRHLSAGSNQQQQQQQAQQQSAMEEANSGYRMTSADEASGLRHPSQNEGDGNRRIEDSMEAAEHGGQTERSRDVYSFNGSPSNSGEDEEDREFDGKRKGDPINGYASKKRRKQSKPIRLGSEEEDVEDNDDDEAEDDVEEGEVRRPHKGMDMTASKQSSFDGDNGEDTPLNLSSGGGAVSATKSMNRSQDLSMRYGGKNVEGEMNTTEEDGQGMEDGEVRRRPNEEGEVGGHRGENGVAAAAAAAAGLRVLGRELMQSPEEKLRDFHNNMYNLAAAGVSASVGLVPPFNLPPHFMFPFCNLSGSGNNSGQSGNSAVSELLEHRQGLSSPGLGAGSVSNSNGKGHQQIFNIEAYCKLCNKEFCNKYFLKTHMANKHGIYSDSPNASGSGGNGGNSSSSGMARYESMPQGPGGLGTPSSMSIGPPPPAMFDSRTLKLPPASSGLMSNSSTGSSPLTISGSFMAMAQRQNQFSLSAGGNVGLPDMEGQSPNRGRGTPTSRTGPDSPLSGPRNMHPLDASIQSSNESMSGHPLSSSPLPSPQNGSGNASSRNHNNSFGSLDKSLVSGMSPTTGPPPLISNPRSEDFRKDHEDGGEGNDMEKVSSMHGENDEENDNHPSYGAKDDEIGSIPPGLRLPLVSPLNPFGPLPFFNMNTMDLMRKEEEHRAKEMFAAAAAAAAASAGRSGSPRPGGGGSSGGSSKGAGGGSRGSMTPDKLRQMGVINADAFCEFCCKEFCNKYFLRVHKLKKHGVCSPELPPEKVQKILQQMAKEAGKTGQPMPPLTLGAPSHIRPPSTTASLSESAKSSLGGPLASPLNLIRPPTLPSFLSLPPLDPIQPGREEMTSTTSSISDKDEREEGRPVNLQFSPRSMMEPECELKIDESSAVIRSPNPAGEKDQNAQQRSGEPMNHDSENARNVDDRSIGSLEERGISRGNEEGSEPSSEGLANLQNMIMKLNSSKQQASAKNNPEASSTVCKKCNKDMENKYFLHAHMMNEHGILHGEEEPVQRQMDGALTPPPVSISLPQYPADLSKLGMDSSAGGFRISGLNIPCPIIPPASSASSSPISNGGLSKLSEKLPLPHDFSKSLFEQMQGFSNVNSFFDQMKLKDLSGGKLDLSPLKRPSLDRDPNKKPASLSRSYCEICKKELCNKYFMKTHMMKMHGIVMDSMPGSQPGSQVPSQQQSLPSSGSVTCEVCKKEMTSRYFLKVHMANMHGLNEDGTPITPSHLRENGLLNMFPMGGPDFGGQPHSMGEFSRLLMQHGEKNSLEMRMKELDRYNKAAQEAALPGHVCSLCSNTFPDIVSLQVHIIKSHGAMPPGSGLDAIFPNMLKPDRHMMDLKMRDDIAEKNHLEKGYFNGNDGEKEGNLSKDADNIQEDEEMQTSHQNNSPVGTIEDQFKGNAGGQDAFNQNIDQDGEKNLTPTSEAQQQEGTGLEKTATMLNELLQRQILSSNSGGGNGNLGLAAPLLNLASGLAAVGNNNNSSGNNQQQFQGLFNMFLSEMLKKVQKENLPESGDEAQSDKQNENEPRQMESNTSKESDEPDQMESSDRVEPANKEDDCRSSFAVSIPEAAREVQELHETQSEMETQMASN